MISKLQLDVSYFSYGWRHLVNAYEGKAGMVCLQVKMCDPWLSAFRYTQYIKRRYINTLPIVSYRILYRTVSSAGFLLCNG